MPRTPLRTGTRCTTPGCCTINSFTPREFFNACAINAAVSDAKRDDSVVDAVVMEKYKRLVPVQEQRTNTVITVVARHLSGSSRKLKPTPWAVAAATSERHPCIITDSVIGLPRHHQKPTTAIHTDVALRAQATSTTLSNSVPSCND